MAFRPQILRTETGTGGIVGEVEFLASEKYTVKRTGATFDATTVGADASGNKILRKGTCVGRISATGLYGAYSNGASDGRQTAVGFLMESVNLKWGNVVAGIVIHGSVLAVRCSGLDAAAKVELTSFTFQ